MMHLVSNDEYVLNRDEHHDDAMITTTRRHSSLSSWDMTSMMISLRDWRFTSAVLPSSSWCWCQHTKLAAMTSAATVRRAVAAEALPLTSIPEHLEAADECRGGSSDSRSLPLLVPKRHPFDGESIHRNDSCSDIQKRMMIVHACHQPLMSECSVPFPVRLYRLLQVDDVSSIISWDHHGRSFHIRDFKKFIFDVLPRYFHQTKLTSFRHQLHLYGFRQIRLISSPSSINSRSHQQHNGSYYHDFFVRDRPDLCCFVVVHRERRGRMPPPQCEHSCRSLLPSSPLPLSPTLPSSVIDRGPLGQRSRSTHRATRSARSYPGCDASHNIPTFYGITPHPLPLSSLSSSSWSSQCSTTTNLMLTTMLPFHLRGNHHHDMTDGEKGGSGTTSQTCHGIHRNHHDSGTIPFRPLSMKPKLPTVIMTKKIHRSTSSS